MLIRISVSEEKVLLSSRSNDTRWVLLFSAVEGFSVLRKVDRAQHPRILGLMWWMSFVIRFWLSFGRVRKIAKNDYQPRKACPSVLLSVCMEHLISHWMGSYENLCWIIFRKSVKKIQVSLKSEKNNGYCIWKPMYIYDSISLNYF